MCSDIYEIISSNLDEARRYVNEFSSLGDIRELFDLAAQDNGANLSAVLNAASMSDVFYFIVQAILADDEVEYDELHASAELISQSLDRYCWLEGYEKFKYLSDGDDMRELLASWQTDSFWLGGDHGAGAIVRPFNDFALLACFISDSASVYHMYVKASLLIAKIVLEAGGVETAEQEFYNDLASSLQKTEEALHNLNSSNSSDSTKEHIQESGLTETANVLAPDEALSEGLFELNSLVGVDSVKQEVGRLMNFLNIRQQRIDQGMSVPTQSLHFVFTGNPGTGKTTVARIVAKIMYGFQILDTPNLVEADRAALVGGYVGQTAIKTNEVIEKATNGVLFVDEAYMLAKSGGEDYGQEAIDTLLKQMEDLRDKLIVIVAGYPNEMAQFIGSNPGLESRFTRYIQFDDYHVSELCQIFDRMCAAHEYSLTQEARANLAILLNRAFVNRDKNFGNARFVRNAYEQVLGNHSDRLASLDGPMTKEMLQSIEAEDLPYNVADGISEPFDVSESRWIAQCPKCEKVSKASLALIAQVVKCKCGTRFRCPWWNLDKKTVPGLVGFEKFERPVDLIGYDVPVA